MTETEWHVCEHPHLLLDLLGERLTDRKLRLFAVACCLRLRHLLTAKPRLASQVRAQQVSLAALAVAERFADQAATADELAEAQREAYAVRPMFADASWAAVWTVAPDAWDAAYEASQEAARALANSASTSAQGAAMAAVVTGARVEDRSTAWSEYELTTAGAREAEQRAQAALLRDIAGSPFRSYAIEPAWLVWEAGTVRRLAESVYADRAFDRLPILADALEEAGCTDIDILNHCRQPAEHGRGCWVVDLLLDKAR